MVLSGADADQLDRLGQGFHQADQRLQHIVREVNGILGRTSWQGRDADQFISQWHGHWSRQLIVTAHALGQSGDDLTRNACQQREASDAGTGGDLRNPFARMTDWLSDVVSGIGLGAGFVAVLSDGADLVSDLPHVKLPGWVTLVAKSSRAIPGLGLIISSIDLNLDITKHLLAGDPLSDEAVGEYAFDIASLGLSTAETALTIATVIFPPIAPVALPVGVGLGVANIGLTITEMAVPDADARLGRIVKQTVGDIVESANVMGEEVGDWVSGLLTPPPFIPVADTALRTAFDIFDGIPTRSVPSNE